MNEWWGFSSIDCISLPGFRCSIHINYTLIFMACVISQQLRGYSRTCRSWGLLCILQHQIWSSWDGLIKKKIKKTKNNFSLRNEKNHQLFLLGLNMQGWPTWTEIRKKFAWTGELKSVKFCTSFISDPPFCALFLKKNKNCDLGTQLLKCISGFDHELLWWPTGQ